MGNTINMLLCIVYYPVFSSLARPNPLRFRGLATSRLLPTRIVIYVYIGRGSECVINVFLGASWKTGDDFQREFSRGSLPLIFLFLQGSLTVSSICSSSQRKHDSYLSLPRPTVPTSYEIFLSIFHYFHFLGYMSSVVLCQSQPADSTPVNCKLLRRKHMADNTYIF